MDKLIIGAGLYGLYAALYCGKRGQQVEVLEIEQAPFTRATYINQARVHMGYHYPRSLSTAMKSAGYFKRFVEDFQPFFLDRRNRVPQILPGCGDPLQTSSGGRVFSAWLV